MQSTLNMINQRPSKNMTTLIQNVTESHILHLTKNNINEDKVKEIFVCLKIMLNGNYQKYKFDKSIFDKIGNDSLSDNEVQETLSKLNEKESIRKANGVYYTPADVVSFMVDNCFAQRLENFTKIVSKINTPSELLKNVVFNDTVFDPTCGTGEFLLGAFLRKINLIQNKKTILSDDKVLAILKTIYGNDINIESIEISKIRLFFQSIKHVKSIENYHKIAKTINENMSCHDFVNISSERFKKYDIIIGNPPYVEDKKSPIKPLCNYGNIYANVLQNSVDLLNNEGVLGFIIPISYISTPRMKKIRKYITEQTQYQVLLNYADRPDCLFTSVHQKLSIIFAKQGKENHRLFTSGYRYWYKDERKHLFEDISTVANNFKLDGFYPKIQNKLEYSVFSKVFTSCNNNILNQNKKQEPNIYLNMRACFWIKAFSFNPGSKEYKGFSFNENLKGFISCLLNSSLFFLYWNTVSDCWHITLKELKHFLIPNVINNPKEFDTLFLKLETKLEKTKKYIGSKQTEYEYKHKMCKDVIDEIDDKLAQIYNLTAKEVDYIKSYANKYRESLGG